MSIGAQLFAIGLTLPCLAFILVMVRRGHLRAKYALLWIPIGVAMLAFAAVPGLLDSVSTAIGVAYPPTVMFTAATVLLTGVCVHMSWELSRLDERLRSVIEHLALEDAEGQRAEAESARSTG